MQIKHDSFAGEDALPFVRVCTVQLARQFPHALLHTVKQHIAPQFPQLTLFYVLDRVHRLNLDRPEQAPTAADVASFATLPHQRAAAFTEEIFGLALLQDQVRLTGDGTWELAGRGQQYLRVG